MSDGNELTKDLEFSLALGEMSQMMTVMLPSTLCLFRVQSPRAGQSGTQIPAEAGYFSRFQDADRFWVSGLLLNWYPPGGWGGSASRIGS